MRLATLIVTTSFVAFVTGCGSGVDTPPLGKVSGTVTLNGEPLDGATIEFQPESGRPSIGTTDAEGNYSLLFRADTPGALVGTHTVRITSQRASSGGEGGEPLVEARPEVVPQDYNDRSTLTVEVTEGSNTHDFALEGKRKPGASSGA